MYAALPVKALPPLPLSPRELEAKVRACTWQFYNASDKPELQLVCFEFFVRFAQREGVHTLEPGKNRKRA